MVVLIEIPFFLSLFVSFYKDCLNLKRNDFNLDKEVDLQNHIKAISSNFVGFNILLQAKHIERFRLKTIKPSSGYYKRYYCRSASISFTDVYVLSLIIS